MDRTRHWLRHRHHPVAVHVGCTMVYAARLDAEGHRRSCLGGPDRLLCLFHLANPALEQFQSGLSDGAHPCEGQFAGGRAGRSAIGRQLPSPARRHRSETAVAGAPLNSTRAGAASGTGSTATAQAPAAPATAMPRLGDRRHIRPIWSTLTSTRTPGFHRCWPRSSGSSEFRGGTRPSLTTRRLSSSASTR